MAARPARADAARYFMSVGFACLVAVTFGACDGRKYASTELLSTLTVCPYGVDEEVLSSYAPDCVRELFHGEIVLIEPDSRYTAPSFNIFTPAVPLQLQAVYGARDLSEDKLIRLNIDPLDALPAFPATEEVSTDSMVVGIAASPDGREHYYWKLNGWRYSLDVPPSEIDRDEALELIRKAK